jgi:hypothetical protein
LEKFMSQGEALRHDDGLRVSLGALRRDLARLSPGIQNEYEALVAELEGQLQRNAPEPEVVPRLLNEIEAIAKCVAFELDMGQKDFAPPGPEERACRPAEQKRRRHCRASLPDSHRSMRRRLRHVDPCMGDA